MFPIANIELINEVKIKFHSYLDHSLVLHGLNSHIELKEYIQAMITLKLNSFWDKQIVKTCT